MYSEAGLCISNVQYKRTLIIHRFHICKEAHTRIHTPTNTHTRICFKINLAHCRGRLWRARQETQSHAVCNKRADARSLNIAQFLVLIIVETDNVRRCFMTLQTRHMTPRGWRKVLFCSNCNLNVWKIPTKVHNPVLQSEFKTRDFLNLQLSNM